MAFSRLIYTPEEIARSTALSTSITDAIMDPNRYRNCNQCRIPLGVTGGNDVSVYSDQDTVDIESQLRGLGRPTSKCIDGYVPSCKEGCPGTEGLPCGDMSCRTDKLTHLTECSMFETNSRPDNKGYMLPAFKCLSRKELRQQKGKIAPLAPTGAMF